MKLKEANISGPLSADKAIVATDPPRIEFEADVTLESVVSQVPSGFSLQGFLHTSHKDLLV